MLLGSLSLCTWCHFPALQMMRFSKGKNANMLANYLTLLTLAILFDDEASVCSPRTQGCFVGFLK